MCETSPSSSRSTGLISLSPRSLSWPTRFLPCP